MSQSDDDQTVSQIHSVSSITVKTEVTSSRLRGLGRGQVAASSLLHENNRLDEVSEPGSTESFLS